jgi:hypothetical protein
MGKSATRAVVASMVAIGIAWMSTVGAFAA